VPSDLVPRFHVEADTATNTADCRHNQHPEHVLGAHPRRCARRIALPQLLVGFRNAALALAMEKKSEMEHAAVAGATTLRLPPADEPCGGAFGMDGHPRFVSGWGKQERKATVNTGDETGQ
jgi:hypothetical protein